MTTRANNNNFSRRQGARQLCRCSLLCLCLSSLFSSGASKKNGEERLVGNIDEHPRRRRRLETINVNRANATAAVAKLVGPNIDTRNETLYSFSTVCLGIFQVDDTGEDLVWPNATWPRSGIILSTGSAESIGGPNEAGGTTTDPDAEFDGTPAPSPIFSMGNSQETTGEGIYYDACHLEFEFKCIGSSDSSESEPTSFSYVFGSEDYPEYINGTNDDFRFLLNGVDMALLNGSTVDSFVDAINEDQNPDLFVKNNHTNPSYNIEADGFTSVLTASGTCNPSINDGWNKIILVIADEYDKTSDSWVLLGESSFVAGAPSTSPSSDPSSEPSSSPSKMPSTGPSLGPTVQPSNAPSDAPSDVPSSEPSSEPSSSPSQKPSARPSFAPSFGPTPVSTGTLTMRRTPPPSSMPSSEPTPDGLGAGQPTLQPSTIVVAPKKVICQCPPDED